MIKYFVSYVFKTLFKMFILFTVYQEAFQYKSKNNHPKIKLVYANWGMCDLLLYLFCYQVFDSWLDIDLKGYEQFVGLKQQHPDKKFLIALGGWTDSRYLLINNSPTPN